VREKYYIVRLMSLNERGVDRVRAACAPLQRCSRWRLACLSNTACALCSLPDATLAASHAPAHRPRRRLQPVSPRRAITLNRPSSHAAWPVVTPAEHARHLSLSFSKLPAPSSLVCLLLIWVWQTSDDKSCRRHVHRWVSFGSWNLIHRWMSARWLVVH
jgi:hypothetical protein